MRQIGIHELDQATPSKLPLVGRVIAVVLLAVGLFVPIAASLSQRATIAVLFPGRVGYFSTQRDAMTQHADEIGVTLRFFYADWDSTQQQRQFDNAVHSGFPVIAICPVTSKLDLDAAQEKLTKIFTFTNSLRPNGNKAPLVQAHVGRDERRSGRLLGQMVERVAKDEPITIGLVEGHEGCPPQIERHDGFVEILSKHPLWSVKWTRRIPGWSQQEFLKRVAQDDVDAVDVVVCQWAGPADTLAESFGTMLPKIVTLESSDSTLTHIANGKISYATTVDILHESKQVVQVGKLLWKDASVPEFVEIQQELVE